MRKEIPSSKSLALNSIVPTSTHVQNEQNQFLKCRLKSTNKFPPPVHEGKSEDRRRLTPHHLGYRELMTFLRVKNLVNGFRGGC